MVLGVLTAVTLSACSTMGDSGSNKISRPAATAPSAPAVSPISARGLTAEHAVTAAVAYHPTIHEALSVARGSRAQIEVTKAGYNPNLQAGVNSSFQKNNADSWRPKIDVSVSQMVYDFGKISSSVDAKTAKHDADQASYQLQQDRIARDTLEAFVEVQRFSQLLVATDERIAGLSAIAKLVSERSSAGASTRSDDLEAESRVQAAKTNKLELQSELQKWRSQLAMMTGLANPSPGATPSWLENSCVDIQHDWSKSPQVLVAEAKKLEAEAGVKSQQASVYPSLVLEGGASYDVMGQASVQDNLDYRLGLSVKATSFDGSAGPALAAAGFAAEGADAAVAASKIEVVNALQTAQHQAGSLKGLLQTLKDRGDAVIERRDIYRQQYIELGTRTLLDLFEAEAEIHQMAFDKINSEFDLLKLGIVCLYSSGNQRAKFGYSDR